MPYLPKKAKAKARLFQEDNNWLVREAEKRHTVVAVIIHEMVDKERRNRLELERMALANPLTL